MKSELGNGHLTTGRCNSLEGPPVRTDDREVPRDIVAVNDEVQYLPMPVRKYGEQRRELRRNRGWIHRDIIDLDGRMYKTKPFHRNRAHCSTQDKTGTGIRVARAAS